jgi:predicted porin
MVKSRRSKLFKKTFITLSILALALTGAAFAEDSDWNFYGVAHASINSLNNGSDNQVGVTSNTSRFGFRGTKPLNDAFTAFWQFESTLDLTGSVKKTQTLTHTHTNSGRPVAINPAEVTVTHEGVTLATRNTFVGVKHEDAGSLLVGRHDTPFKALGRKVEVFSDQLGDHRAMTQGWDRRLTEVVAWKSPDWSGFGVFAAYQFDQADLGAVEPKTAFSGMVSYATEQFMVGAAYEAFSSAYGVTLDSNPTEYSDGPAAMRLAGKYMAEQFDVCALFQSVTTKVKSGNEFADETSMLVGGGATFHANEKWDIKGAFYMLNTNTDAEDVTTTRTVDESDTQATMLALGVERIFSKNVAVYAQFASVSNGDATNIALAGSDSGFGGGISGAAIAATEYGDDDDLIAGTYDNPVGISVGTVVSW